MGFGEFAEQRPHPRFKPLVVVPTLAVVGVPPGPHVRARRAADGVGAVGILKVDAGLRDAVDVRRGMAERRMSGTAEHAAIPAFGEEEDDIRSWHRASRTLRLKSAVERLGCETQCVFADVTATHFTGFPPIGQPISLTVDPPLCRPAIVVSRSIEHFASSLDLYRWETGGVVESFALRGTRSVL